MKSTLFFVIVNKDSFIDWHNIFVTIINREDDFHEIIWQALIM